MNEFENIVAFEQLREPHTEGIAGISCKTGAAQYLYRSVRKRLDVVPVIMLVAVPSHLVAGIQEEVDGVIVAVQNRCWHEPSRANLVLNLNSEQRIAFAASESRSTHSSRSSHHAIDAGKDASSTRREQCGQSPAGYGSLSPKGHSQPLQLSDLCRTFKRCGQVSARRALRAGARTAPWLHAAGTARWSGPAGGWAPAATRRRHNSLARGRFCRP